MFNLVNKKKLLFISVLILNFAIFIPTAKSIKDTVYLEAGNRTSEYTLETVEGDLMLWECRTYNDSFHCSLRDYESISYVSWGNIPDKGIIEVLEHHTYRFRFKNEDRTGGGYLEFEIKIIKRIQGYNSSLIFIVISFVSIISILTVKRLRIA